MFPYFKRALEVAVRSPCILSLILAVTEFLCKNHRIFLAFYNS